MSPIPTNRALMMSIVREALNTTCPIRIVTFPSTVATTDASAAICKLTMIAGMKAGSCRPALNQHPVKPFQTAMFPIWAGGIVQTFVPWKLARAGADGLLNANTAITRIGRNRNA